MQRSKQQYRVVPKDAVAELQELVRRANSGGHLPQELAVRGRREVQEPDEALVHDPIQVYKR